MGPFGRNAPAGAGRRLGGLRLWPLLLFGAYFVYYWFSHQQDASFTGRRQLVDTSIEQEVQLGLQSYQEILSQAQVVTTGEIPQQVDAIMQRLVAVGPAVEEYLAQQKGTPKQTPWSEFEWEVAVLDSEQVNAFCLPGGKMAVYTGLIPVAQNTDGLAVVMGHEIAHALLRHGGERLAQQKLMQVGQMAAGVAMGEMDPGQQRMIFAALGAGLQYGVLLPYARDHETEADYLGLMLAAAACFNPGEAPRLWERMAAAGGGQSPPEFMSTHPHPGSRIEQLNALQAEAGAIRAALCQTQ
ncbi:MAG TPA: M48 family metallopeptidase [Candidatus Saccharimonadia bacterium]|nr:M48 family metallopeptidase [Candidatus Saccharimonadia bacterium]